MEIVQQNPRAIQGCAERGHPAWGSKAVTIVQNVPGTRLITLEVQNSKPVSYRQHMSVHQSPVSRPKEAACLS